MKTDIYLKNIVQILDEVENSLKEYEFARRNIMKDEYATLVETRNALRSACIHIKRHNIDYVPIYVPDNILKGEAKRIDIL